MTMAVDRLGAGFVARVTGVDLGAMTADDRVALHRAYLAHKVLVIPDQTLSLDAFAAFGRLFGEIAKHPVARFTHPDHPDVMVLSNDTRFGKPAGLRDAGSYWHSDRAYMAETANATILYSQDIPDDGGDTLFADLEAAYDTLPGDLKAQLDGRRYVCHYRWTADRDDPESRWMRLTPEEQDATPPVERPLVRTHPETGRRSLFVFPGIACGVRGVIGMDDGDSGSMLRRVFDHMVDERFQYRFKWPGPGVVVLWDNRCVMHKATTKQLPPDKLRTLFRVSTMAGVPA